MLSALCVPSWHGPDCPSLVVIVGDRTVPDYPALYQRLD